MLPVPFFLNGTGITGHTSSTVQRDCQIFAKHRKVSWLTKSHTIMRMISKQPSRQLQMKYVTLQFHGLKLINMN